MKFSIVSDIPAYEMRSLNLNRKANSDLLLKSQEDTLLNENEQQIELLEKLRLYIYSAAH